MRILKDPILEMIKQYVSITNSRHLGIDVRVDDHTDTIATLAMLEEAKVIVVDTEQALALIPAIAQFEEQLDFRLPFPSVMLQFSHPFPEDHLLQQEGSHAEIIQAIIVAQENGVNSASVWFESTRMNRVAWNNVPTSELRISETAAEEMQRNGRDVYFADEQFEATENVKRSNMEAIRRLVCAIVAYINCDNVRLSEVSAPRRVNAKRARKGKKPLQPYHLVEVIRHEYEDAGEVQKKGRSPSIRFDVRGHFRSYKTGKTIWVQSHQRGLANDLYVPKAYLVK